jgi:hypothetical protein
MDRYVVIGNPVAHSQSPFIHTAFAQQTGQSMEYGRRRCELDEFARSLQGFADEGGRGCNVTMPFKFDAFRLAATRTERGELAGACNALRREGNTWRGDNTDGAGLLRDIERNAGVALRGLRILLIGAGGAASGVLGPLLAARPAERVDDRVRAIGDLVRLGDLAKRWSGELREAFERSIRDQAATDQSPLGSALARFNTMPRWQRLQTELLTGEGTPLLGKLGERHDVQLLELNGGAARKLWQPTSADSVLPAALPKPNVLSSRVIGSS